MRLTLHQHMISHSNARLLNVDFHDFLQKAAYLEDVELAHEFALTTREVQELRAKTSR